MSYELVFDKEMIRQLQELARNKGIKDILVKMLDKIEVMGPRAGKLLDVRMGIYEVKAKSPPIRLYYRYIRGNNEIYIFEYNMKSSAKKQQSIINRIRKLLKS